MYQSGRINFDLRQGAKLPVLTKMVVQDRINAYAEAARDFNPIHIDENYARQTPAGGTIAHGMLVLAHVSQMMTGAFGMDWVIRGRLDIRFKAPARPGDKLTCEGQITGIDKGDNSSIVSCEITVTNQKDEVIVLGNTEVILSDG